MKFHFNELSLDEIGQIINQIVEQLGNNTIIVFEGAMGSGKTTLIKSLCNFLNVTDQVNSPTYALVNEYQTTDRKKIYHFDFYRIKNLDEAFDMGIEEYFHTRQLCLIEWAEKIKEILPEHYLKVSIHYHQEKRDYTIEKI